MKHSSKVAYKDAEPTKNIFNDVDAITTVLKYLSANTLDVRFIDSATPNYYSRNCTDIEFELDSFYEYCVFAHKGGDIRYVTQSNQWLGETYATVFGENFEIGITDFKKILEVDCRSLVLQSLEKYNCTTAYVVSELTKGFGSYVTTSAFYTPPSRQSIDVHYDKYDVLVHQLYGEKRWRVYLPHLSHVNINQPGTIVLEKDIRDEQPYLNLVMKPGDLLYVPKGWIHYCVNESDSIPSLHVSYVQHVDNVFTLLKKATEQALDSLNAVEDYFEPIIRSNSQDVIDELVIENFCLHLSSKIKGIYSRSKKENFVKQLSPSFPLNEDDQETIKSNKATWSLVESLQSDTLYIEKAFNGFKVKHNCPYRGGIISVDNVNFHIINYDLWNYVMNNEKFTLNQLNTKKLVDENELLDSLEVLIKKTGIFRFSLEPTLDFI